MYNKDCKDEHAFLLLKYGSLSLIMLLYLLNGVIRPTHSMSMALDFSQRRPCIHVLLFQLMFLNMLRMLGPVHQGLHASVFLYYIYSHSFCSKFTSFISLGCDKCSKVQKVSEVKQFLCQNCVQDKRRKNDILAAFLMHLLQYCKWNIKLNLVCCVI